MFYLPLVEAGCGQVLAIPCPPSDIQETVDEGDVAILALFELSAAPCDITQWNGRPCSPCLGVHRWNSELDAVEKTPTQRRQYRINLTCYSEASSCTSGYSDYSRLWDHLTIVFGSWPSLFCRWEPTLRRRLPTASLHFARFAVFAGRCQHQR